LTSKAAGAGLLPVHDPSTPKRAVRPAGRAGAQAGPEKVTVGPDWDQTAYHAWRTSWPAA
jgi:hypothetical protein